MNKIAHNDTEETEENAYKTRQALYHTQTKALNLNIKISLPSATAPPHPARTDLWKNQAPSRQRNCLKLANDPQSCYDLIIIRDKLAAYYMKLINSYCRESTMGTVQELIDQAAGTDTNSRDAASTMVALARIYSSETENFPPDLEIALGWAERAARLDHPDGYLEITKILGTACITPKTPDVIKTEYASYIIDVCDQDTITKFRRPDIAYYVGTVCEHMADHFRDRPQRAAEYCQLAHEYYSLSKNILQTTTSFEIFKPVVEKCIPRIANKSQKYLTMPQPASPQTSTSGIYAPTTYCLH